MQKNQGNPMCSFLEKRLHRRERETDRERRVTIYRSESARWASDQKSLRDANFESFEAQNDLFLSYPEKKQKRHFFTLPKTSIHAKNQGNPMCGFIEKRLRAKQIEARHYLMVRIRPVGVGPKIRKF